MRALRIVLAVAALVAIGTVEALESLRQLYELPGRGRPPFSIGGSVLTLVSIALSAAVFGVLGWTASQTEPHVVRDGATAGIFAGLIGGTARGLLVRDYVGGVMSRFGLSEEIAGWSLATLVVLSIVVTAAGGALVTWLSLRWSRHRPPRPPT